MDLVRGLGDISLDGLLVGVAEDRGHDGNTAQRQVARIEGFSGSIEWRECR